MRVTLVGDYPPPVGGIAVHLAQLWAFLNEHSVKTRVLDIGKGRQSTPGVVPVRTWAGFALWVAGLAVLEDVVHLHISGNNRKAWLVAAALARPSRQVRSPRMITLHSGLVPRFLGESAAHRACARAVLSGYQQVVAVSPAVQAAVLSCGVAPERVQVLPAFLSSQVRLGLAPEGLAPMRQRRQPLLGMAYAPGPVYGFDLMLQAVACLAPSLPRLGLAVFGPGTDSPEFRRAIRAAGVEGQVESFGALDHPRALALMAQCDLFVRPTLADGDSLSVREALALGISTVASDACERPVGVRSFRSGDSGSLAGAIQSALGSRPAAAQTVDSGAALLALYRALSQRIHTNRRPVKVEAAG